MDIPEKNFVFRTRQEVKIRLEYDGDSCMDDTEIAALGDEIIGPWETGCNSDGGCYSYPMSAIGGDGIDIEYVMCLDIWHGFPLYTTGDNTEWQLGDGGVLSVSDLFIPIGDDISVEWLQAVAGGDSSFAYNYQDSSWYGWGDNTYGQLGLSGTESKNTPTQIFDLRLDRGIPYSNNSFISKNGKLVTGWHGSEHGLINGLLRLETDPPYDVYSDIDIPFHLHETQGWVSYVFSLATTMGVAQDGTLWVQGTLVPDPPVPESKIYMVQMGTDTDWAEIIDVDISYSFAVKQGGTLWGWNQHVAGDWAQIGSDTDWVGCNVLCSDSGGTIGTMLVKADNSIWGYGTGLEAKTTSYLTEDNYLLYYPTDQLRMWVGPGVYDVGINKYNNVFRTAVLIDATGYLWYVGESFSNGDHRLTDYSTTENWDYGWLREETTLGDGWSFWSKSQKTVLQQNGNYWVRAHTPQPYTTDERYADNVNLHRLLLPPGIAISDVKEVSLYRTVSHCITNDGVLWLCGDVGWMPPVDPVDDTILIVRDWALAQFEQVAGIEAITVSATHSLAKKLTVLYGAGDISEGALGDTVTSDVSVFTRVQAFDSNISVIKCSPGFSFASLDSGGVYCTGRNTDGQLGLGHNTQQDSFTEVPLNEIQALATGDKHTAVITKAGGILTTGDNTYGQLGHADGDRNSFDSVGQYTDSVPVKQFSDYQFIAHFTVFEGVLHRFLVYDDDFTPNISTYSTFPTTPERYFCGGFKGVNGKWYVPGPTSIESNYGAEFSGTVYDDDISSYDEIQELVLPAGTIDCYFGSVFGYFGAGVGPNAEVALMIIINSSGSMDIYIRPVNFIGGNDDVGIYIGYLRGYPTTLSGWTYGEHNFTTWRSITAIDSGRWRTMGVGDYEDSNHYSVMFFAISDDDDLYVWGDGMIGSGFYDPSVNGGRHEDLAISFLMGNVKQVRPISSESTLILTNDGDLYVIGAPGYEDMYGSVGVDTSLYPDNTDWGSPVKIGTDFEWVSPQYQAEQGNCVLVKTDGTVYVFGHLYSSSTPTYTHPMARDMYIYSFNSWRTIVFRGYPLMQLNFDATDDHIWMYVTQSAGARQRYVDLSFGNCIRTVSIESTDPLELDIIILSYTSTIFDTGTNDCVVDAYTHIVSGVGFTASLDIDGHLWVCGRNDYGQLGVGTQTTVPTFTKVAGDAVFTGIVAGDYHLILKGEGGTLFACGKNDKGQLGVGHFNLCLVPTEVVILEGAKVIEVAAGTNHSVAIISNNS